MTDEMLQKGLEFISAVSNMPKGIPGIQDNMMLRVNFLEAIVRIAIQLNKQKKLNLTESQSLESFILNDVIPNTKDIIQEWEDFRKDKLWK